MHDECINCVIINSKVLKWEHYGLKPFTIERDLQKLKRIINRSHFANSYAVNFFKRLLFQLKIWPDSWLLHRALTVCSPWQLINK